MKKIYKYVLGELPKDVARNIDCSNLSPEQEKQLEDAFGVEFKEVILSTDKYEENNTLAVKLMSRPDKDDAIYFGLTEKEMEKFSSVFSVITKNLDMSVLLPSDTQFVDENNNPGIGRWLTENKIAKKTRYKSQNSFVTYRAYKFNLSTITDNEANKNS